jgi:hypothetical protein
LPLRACSVCIQPGAFVHLKSGKIRHFVFTPNLFCQELPKFEFISGVTDKFACLLQESPKFEFVSSMTAIWTYCSASSPAESVVDLGLIAKIKFLFHYSA